MSATTTSPSDTSAERTRPAKAGRWLIAAGVGVAVGAVGLIGYAYAVRLPTVARSAETLGGVGGFFLWYLILASVITVLMGGVGVAALRGRDSRGLAASLLAAAVALTAWVYMSSTSASVAARISGPGARPAVPVAQSAWPLLAVAALLLLIGVVLATGTRLSPPRALVALLSPFTVVGVVASVVAGTVVATWWERGQVHPATVETIAVAPLPTTLGDTVAYTVDFTDPTHIVPAGPGFVVFEDDGGIVAYDGTTGAQRWSVADSVFPTECGLRKVRSTGMAADSVVIAECVRQQTHPLPGDAIEADRSEPVLLGFDANTGRLLWLTDENFALASGAGQSASVGAVTRRDEVGSLDAASGTVRWVKTANRDPCDGADVVDDDIALERCFDGSALRILDGLTGAERTIDLPAPALLTGVLTYTWAADGTLLVYGVRTTRPSREPGESPRTEFSTLGIDVASGQTFTVPSAVGDIPDSPRPGSLLQLRSGGALGQPPATEVYSLPDRRLVRAGGFEVSPSEWSSCYATLSPGLRARKNRQRHGNEQAPAAHPGPDHPQARRGQQAPRCRPGTG